MAVEYGPYGIRANCVVPSTIRSPIIEPYLQDENAKKFLESSFPLRRIGEPEDISAVGNIFVFRRSRVDHRDLYTCRRRSICGTMRRKIKSTGSIIICMRS